MFLPYGDEGSRESGTPWITWSLIAGNVLVFFRQFTDVGRLEAVVMAWGFVPAEPSAATALASMFLHADLMHLIGNMWFLFVFGDNVELRLGRLKYLACYLLSGLGGTFCYYLFFRDSATPMIGASGAIYGVMGMYLFLFPHNRVKFVYVFLVIIGTCRLAAFWAIGYWFAKEVLFGYLSTQGQEAEGGVAHLAHAGGLAVGLVAVKGLTMAGLLEDDGRSLWSWLAGRGRAPRAGFGTRAPARVPADALRAAIRAGRADEAWRLWRLDPHANLPPEELLEFARALDRGGEAHAAFAVFSRVLQFPGRRQAHAAEAHLGLARLLMVHMRETGDEGRRLEAAAHLHAALATHPDPIRREVARLWLASVDPGGPGSSGG